MRAGKPAVCSNAIFEITELTDMRKSNMIWQAGRQAGRQAGSLAAYIYYNQFFNEVIERITSPFNDCFFC